MSSDPTMTIPATEAPPGSQPPPPPPPPAPPEERRPADRPPVRGAVVARARGGRVRAAARPAEASRSAVTWCSSRGRALKGAWLGLDGWVAGAVPADFLVAIGSLIAPGDILQKADARRDRGAGRHRRRRAAVRPRPGRPAGRRRRSTSGTRSSTSGSWSATGRSWSATRACRGSRGRPAASTTGSIGEIGPGRGVPRARRLDQPGRWRDRRSCSRSLVLARRSGRGRADRCSAPASW